MSMVKNQEVVQFFVGPFDFPNLVGRAWSTVPVLVAKDHSSLLVNLRKSQVSTYVLMYVGVVELLRNLPLYGGGSSHR